MKIFYFISRKLIKKIFIFSFFVLFFYYKIKYLFNYYLFIYIIKIIYTCNITSNCSTTIFDDT